MSTFLGFGLWVQTSITKVGLFVSRFSDFMKALSYYRQNLLDSSKEILYNQNIYGGKTTKRISNHQKVSDGFLFNSSLDKK
jgi:hypothetical protein